MIISVDHVLENGEILSIKSGPGIFDLQNSFSTKRNGERNLVTFQAKTKSGMSFKIEAQVDAIARTETPCLLKLVCVAIDIHAQTGEQIQKYSFTVSYNTLTRTGSLQIGVQYEHPFGPYLPNLTQPRQTFHSVCGLNLFDLIVSLLADDEVNGGKRIQRSIELKELPSPTAHPEAYTVEINYVSREDGSGKNFNYFGRCWSLTTGETSVFLGFMGTGRPQSELESSGSFRIY